MTQITRTLSNGQELAITSDNQSVTDWEVKIGNRLVGDVTGVHKFRNGEGPKGFSHYVKFAHDTSFCVVITSKEWAALEPQWETDGTIDEGTRKTGFDAVRPYARRETLMEFNDENVEFG